jgi:hypothetical protein
MLLAVTDSHSSRGTLALSAEQTEQWRRCGWVKMSGAIAPDGVADLTRWVEEVTLWADGDRGLHHFELTDRGPTIARSEYFADRHGALGAFVRGPLIGDVLAALFGEPPVLFKEKINYKHPGGGGFAPHQDATAYRFVDHHISVMVPIDPSTRASGCLYVAPGHARGPMPIDDRGRIREDIAESLAWEALEVEPGDIVFFDSYTPHHSDTNTTDRARRVLYLTYNAASRGDFRAAYYADKQAEFANSDGTYGNERVRISVIDDFLGRTVPSGGPTPPEV